MTAPIFFPPEYSPDHSAPVELRAGGKCICDGFRRRVLLLEGKGRPWDREGARARGVGDVGKLRQSPERCMDTK